MTFRVNPMILAAAGATLAGAAQAQVAWFPASGSGSFFDYQLGHNSNTNLFGSPVLVGNSFLFTPSNFVAQSLNGQAASATDQMNVQLIAHAGERFTQISIQEFGSWAITGVGSVQDSGTMFIQDMVTPRPAAFQTLGCNPVMPITTAGSGSWNGQVTIDLDAIVGPAWTNVTLIFTNTLQASTSGAGSAATITKNLVSGPSVIVTILPTPGSGAMLAAGCALALRRRRR